ncbi:MAG TPA: hypothetical protein VFY93_18110 [Planctomycetota bacterium]|nr:hypothetical protein [Planctomycetota bacterium]
MRGIADEHPGRGAIRSLRSLGAAFGLVCKIGAPAGTMLFDLDGDGIPELLAPDESFSF